MGKQILAAQIVVRTLEKEGVKCIFGYPGGQAGAFYNALQDSKIRHILVRSEKSAVFMADAYAKLTGQVGASSVVSGVGTTLGSIGVYAAYTDSTPLLLISNHVPYNAFGKGQMQEMDEVSFFKPITKWSTVLIEPNMAMWTVQTAIRTALGGRRGPVFIQLPIDIMAKPISHTEIHKNPKIGFRIRETEENGIDEAVELLVNAQRPVLFVGGGSHFASRAEKEIFSLADCLRSPIVTTWMGTGVVSGDHPLYFGQLGMNARSFTKATVQEADVLLAVGCRFSSNSTDYWSQIHPDTKIIHIDIDPREIGKNYPVAIGITGDAKTVLSKMIDRIKGVLPEKVNRDEWINGLIKIRKDWFAAQSKKIDSDAFPLKPQRVCTEIDSYFDKKTIFTLDAGANDHWVSYFIRPREPRAWLRNGAGAMGYALPAGLTAKLLCADRTVVAIMGDGGFMQSFEELATAVQLELPIVVCVLNDGSLNYPRVIMKHIFKKDFTKYTDFIHPDFGKLAEAFGCFGIQVDRPSKIKPALEDALKATREGKPAVIDFLIDKNETLDGYRSLVEEE